MTDKPVAKMSFEEAMAALEQVVTRLERGDEIGELAGALSESARALWARMDAIERFAADILLPAALVTLIVGQLGVLGSRHLGRMAAFAALGQVPAKPA